MSIISRTSRIAWAVAVASSAAVASAATVDNVWSGTSPGDYYVADNWSKIRVPGSHGVDWDRVIIGSGATVALDKDVKSFGVGVNMLTVNDGATLRLNPDGYLKVEAQSAWNHAFMHLGTSGSGHVVVDGGTLDVRGIQVKNSSTLTVNSGNMLGQWRALEVGVTSGATATVTVTGGNLHHSSGSTFGANGGTGILNQSAGEFVALTKSTIGADNNSTGILNLSGGETWLQDPTIGDIAGSTGTINLSDNGILNFSRFVSIGIDGTGSIIISDSAIFRGNSVTPIGNMQHGDAIRTFNLGTGTGTGLFKVIGNDASVSINRGTTGNTNFVLGANGTLAFDIDDATVSPVNFSTGTVATLTGIIDLGLINSYTPATGTTYNLLTGAATIVDNGFSLAAGDEASWSLSILGTAGSGQTLQATYIATAVPEPASLGLLGLAAGAMLRRRRV